MPRVFLSLGSNIEREHNIRSAVRALRRRFGDLQLSRVYESEAVGFDGDAFYNLVAAFDTEEDVHAVNRALAEIEDSHGRDRSGPRFSSRTLDIDLLLYGDRTLDEQGLRLPRGEITRNAFDLQPLAELAPDLRHPLEGRSYAELWADFDQASQRLWPVDFDYGT